MIISEIMRLLEELAPPGYAEEYDNVGLLTGDKTTEVKGVLCTLDCTEAVVEEAIKNNCNLIVAHHPIIFRGLKKITGANYVERTVIKAIKNDIAIYAIHTNVDNVHTGVNRMIAAKIGLAAPRILRPKSGGLVKLAVFVPDKDREVVEQALFNAGAGHIGNYSECSFGVEGMGGYKANELANPAIGEKNVRHREPETRVEVIFPEYLSRQIVAEMIKAHPYEEVAYDLYPLKNNNQLIGSGMVGELEKPMSEKEFMTKLKDTFGTGCVRHTPLKGREVKRVAVCGGSGSFLIGDARASGADVFVTGDVKYHEFFDAENQIVIMDIGHYESEQFTSQLLANYLESRIKNIAKFAVRLSGVGTNPVNYF